ncbi:hypothetical protein OR1_03656 [Geobacter sp. OR-1]|uniref:hypothetical protein n=1 Tax=Geobacter sp. OR-1 TaxID=1266765 RepID=UPI000542D102|nr:hypothetical protein [Geobacter sp. OR-1]GAM11343.1 hypothetical protein OR1_03656 [Geobacter sp. OR-1]
MNKVSLGRLESIRNELTAQIDAMRVLAESDSARSIELGALLTILAASLGKSKMMIREMDEMLIDVERILAEHERHKHKLAEIKKIIEINLKSIFTSFIFNFNYTDNCNLSDFVRLKELLEISSGQTTMEQAKCFDNNRNNRTNVYSEVIEKTTKMIIKETNKCQFMNNIALRTFFLYIAADLIHHTTSPLGKQKPTTQEIKDFITYIENYHFSCG